MSNNLTEETLEFLKRGQNKSNLIKEKWKTILNIEDIDNFTVHCLENTDNFTVHCLENTDGAIRRTRESLIDMIHFVTKVLKNFKLKDIFHLLPMTTVDDAFYYSENSSEQPTNKMRFNARPSDIPFDITDIQAGRNKLYNRILEPFINASLVSAKSKVLSKKHQLVDSFYNSLIILQQYSNCNVKSVICDKKFAETLTFPFFTPNKDISEDKDILTLVSSSVNKRINVYVYDNEKMPENTVFCINTNDMVNEHTLVNPTLVYGLYSFFYHGVCLIDDCKVLNLNKNVYIIQIQE